MNAEQEVNEVAAWMRDEWSKAPCWRALARKVLSVEDEACESAPEPECQANRFDTFEEFMEHALGEPCPNDGVFRLLQEGDVIQYGDQVRLLDKWYPIHETSVVGQAVCSSESVALPAGYYRRLLDEEKDVDHCLEGGEFFRGVLTREMELQEQLEVLQEQFDDVVKQRDELQEKFDALLQSEMDKKGFVVIGPSDDLSEVSKLVCRNSQLQVVVDELHAKLQAIHTFTEK